jgi:hypothetical protein
MPEFNLHFVTLDAKIMELGPVSSNQAFRMRVVVSGRESAYNAIRGQNAVDIQTLNGRRGMGHVNELGLSPSRNVRVGSFERHELVAGKTFVARRGMSTDRWQGNGGLRFDGIPEGVMNFAAKSVTFGMKMEGDARDSSHSGTPQ